MIELISLKADIYQSMFEEGRQKITEYIQEQMKDYNKV